MIEEQLDKFIVSENFHRLEVNVDKLKVYYRAQEGCCSILAVYYFPEQGAFTAQGQENIRNRIREHFFVAGMPEQDMLSIVVTEEPQMGRKLFGEGEKYWILNTLSGQLMLYEDQSGDFCAIRKPLEQMLYSWYTQIAGLKNEKTKKMPAVVNLVLVVLNVVIFCLNEWRMAVRSDDAFYVYGALNAKDVLEGKEYYRLFTYMFLHGGMDHLLNNMLILFVIGNKVETLVGRYKYLFLYFASGILAGIASMSYNTFIDREVSCVGASGAIFGIVGAMAAVVLIHRGKVEGLTGKQMLLFILLSLYGGFTSQGVDNMAHIGGLVAGFILALLIYRKSADGKKRLQ